MREAAEIVGITYRQLDYWARTDLVRPSLADAKGSGTRRRYAYSDLLELKVIKSLLDAGISSRSCATVIIYLRDNLGEDITAANLVIHGTGSVLAQNDGEICRSGAKGQGVLNIVPLAGMKEELDASDHRTAPRPEPAGPRGGDATGGVSWPRRATPCGGSEVLPHSRVRPQHRAAVRQAARLLRHRMGVRAPHVRPQRDRAGNPQRRSARTSTCRPTTSTSRSPRSTRSW